MRLVIEANIHYKSKSINSATDADKPSRNPSPQSLPAVPLLAYQLTEKRLSKGYFRCQLEDDDDARSRCSNRMAESPHYIGKAANSVSLNDMPHYRSGLYRYWPTIMLALFAISTPKLNKLTLEAS